MGIELAQESEWAESRELDWWLLDHVEHRGVHDLVGDLNRRYRDTPALWTQDQDPAGFSWIDANDSTQQRLLVPADGHRRRTGRLRRPTSRPSRTTTTGSASPKPVRGTRSSTPTPSLLRLWRRQPRRSRGGRGGVARPPASATVQLPPLGTIWLELA